LRVRRCVLGNGRPFEFTLGGPAMRSEHTAKVNKSCLMESSSS
jgi:hypothetical protein